MKVNREQKKQKEQATMLTRTIGGKKRNKEKEAEDK